MDDNTKQILELLKDYDYLELRKIIGTKLVTTTVEEIRADDEED